MALSKGIRGEIQLNLDGWYHIQALDYEKLPFKCNLSQEYGHVAKSRPKSPVSRSSLNPTPSEEESLSQDPFSSER